MFAFVAGPEAVGSTDTCWLRPQKFSTGNDSDSKTKTLACLKPQEHGRGFSRKELLLARPAVSTRYFRTASQ